MDFKPVEEGRVYVKDDLDLLKDLDGRLRDSSINSMADTFNLLARMGYTRFSPITNADGILSGSDLVLAYDDGLTFRSVKSEMVSTGSGLNKIYTEGVVFTYLLVDRLGTSCKWKVISPIQGVNGTIRVNYLPRIEVKPTLTPK
ncbi:MAG TPA: hypothetical protein VJI98_06605 [Candidatus Nanoarchaeia archaeon]|nr:hypothetical protein [Candidatus Nanoarchaeia archaeon]